MPALLEPQESAEIRIAEIVGFTSKDQCDSLPQAIYEWLQAVPARWNATAEDIIASGIVTREQLKQLGATRV